METLAQAQDPVEIALQRRTGFRASHLHQSVELSFGDLQGVGSNGGGSNNLRGFPRHFFY